MPTAPDPITRPGAIAPRALRSLVVVALAMAGLSAFTLPAAAASPPTELFISEYVEGSGNNKAVEIYNGTDSSIDLSAGAYAVSMYFNGSATAATTVKLAGSIAARGTWVLASSSAAPALLERADQTSGASFFNGDDAITLTKAGAVIDSFGQIGVDPGTEWDGGGLNDTLRRSATICSGDTDPSDAFAVGTDWDVLGQDDFSGLGAHTTSCAGPGGDGPDGDGPAGDDGSGSTGQNGCESTTTPIHAIQGSGSTSPLKDRTVTAAGIVTAVTPGLEGFYLQSAPGDIDDDPATSEGVFVYAPGLADSPNSDDVGRRAVVTGRVAEYSTNSGASSPTQIVASQATICGTDTTDIDPIQLHLPFASTTAPESAEGMLATLPQSLVISEYFNYDRFGEVVVRSERTFQPTSYLQPGPEAAGRLDAARRDALTIDDASTQQNPGTLIHPGNGRPFSQDNRFRGGDTITGITGVIDDTFGSYRLQPTSYGTYAAANHRTDAPDPVGGRLKVAGFNVLNYFSTVDSGRAICGPAENQDCRGADSAVEFERQRAKIIAAISRIDADVVGLTELENNPRDEAIDDLVAGLNAATAPGTYAALPTGPIGSDAIRVGLIYKPAAVRPAGAFAVLDSSIDSRFDDSRNRPALAQTFTDTAGGTVTVAVNHLKSKGSACAPGDPDTGDGSGNCNLTRTRAATALVDWLAGDPTDSGDPDRLIIGDLNSYDEEDPIDAITAGPDDAHESADDYTDLVERFQGEDSYSYLFDGLFGDLDYALASASLNSQVTGTTVWHINADEPDIFDYNTEFRSAEQQGLYSPDPYRASDHDPVVVGLDLTADLNVGSIRQVDVGRDRSLTILRAETAPVSRCPSTLRVLVDGRTVFGPAQTRRAGAHCLAHVRGGAVALDRRTGEIRLRSTSARVDGARTRSVVISIDAVTYAASVAGRIRTATWSYSD